MFALERATIRTFDRQTVKVADSTWEWRSRPNAGRLYVCDFEQHLVAPGLLMPESLPVVRWWIARMLETRKGSTARRHITALKHFARWRRTTAVNAEPRPLDLGVVTALELIRYNEFLLASKRKSKSQYFSDLRRMLRGVVPRAPQLFQSGIVEALAPVAAPRPRQGHAVRTRDPKKGALTSGELYALRKAVEEGVGTELQRVLVLVCLETGLYAESLSDLRVGEIEDRDEDTFDRATGRYTTTKQWVLHRPRVKKRTTHRETKEFYVTVTTGEALAAQARRARGAWMFPELRTDNPPLTLKAILTDFAATAGLVNERTGEGLQLSARRLRYSLGTGLAADGHEPETIAHALDHGHTKEAKAYIEVSQQVVDRVNQQLTPVAERFIQRFRGKIGRAEETAARALPVVPNQGPSLDTDASLSGIGGCGAGTLCKLAWPLSCYGCNRFVAWADADHQGVLTALLERRELFRSGGEPRVVAQFDDVILAVQDVIAEVARRQEEGA